VDESRRSLIKKAAVGTGLIWATPVLTSLATAASAGTARPCDCARPAPTGRQLGCLTFGCPPFIYHCSTIKPCDAVTLACGTDLVFCRWTFTADCASVPGFASGTVTSREDNAGGRICDLVPIHVGDQVAFEYQTP
jgi:hypothetical protein